MTFAERAAAAAQVLQAAGITSDESRRDASRLARWLLGWDAARWIADARGHADSTFLEAYADLVARRRAREPMAYLMGEQEFYGRRFRVTRDVLIPRPETELLVEEARRVLTETSRSVPLLLDAGTGSGCLAITLVLEHPEVKMIATDTSGRALDVARLNAQAFGVAERIEFRSVSLAGALEEAVDVLVSNPPYVADTTRANLAPEVRDYEPTEALFGGPDGLDVIRALTVAAARALVPGGWLLMEIGAGQAPAIADIIGTQPVLDLRLVRPDLAGHARIAIVQKSPARARLTA